MFRLWAGTWWWRRQLESPGRGRGGSRGKFLARRFPEEQQLCVSSCWAVGKPFFLSEPPVLSLQMEVLISTVGKL